MKLSVLLLAIWLHYTTCRRLRDTISNEIGDTSNYVRSKDWVRISHDPVPLINAPVGTKVEIECEIIGSPAPSVQWLKGNTPITDVSHLFSSFLLLLLLFTFYVQEI